MTNRKAIAARSALREYLATGAILTRSLSAYSAWLNGFPEQSRSNGRALFIPLNRKYFEAFTAGTKRTEYRQYGPRWNERVCTPGRAVVLSLGYGKATRICGTITGFRKVPVDLSSGTLQYVLLYGTGSNGPVAEIDIRIG